MHPRTEGLPLVVVVVNPNASVTGTGTLNENASEMRETEKVKRDSAMYVHFAVSWSSTFTLDTAFRQV